MSARCLKRSWRDYGNLDEPSDHAGMINSERYGGKRSANGPALAPSLETLLVLFDAQGSIAKRCLVVKGFEIVT